MCRSNDNESSRRAGLANLWSTVAFFRSWRFIGPIVTRAAPRNFCPRKNIFTPRDGAERPSETSRGDEEEGKSRASDRDADDCGQDTEKSETDESSPGARFTDYRSGARDLSDGTRRVVVVERFPSGAKLRARRKHAREGRRPLCERNFERERKEEEIRNKRTELRRRDRDGRDRASV